MKKRNDVVFSRKKASDISLWLESYNDIFSDFDPRPYFQKALSDDFLQEIKRASKDKAGIIELRLFIPKKGRNKKEEINIKNRLKEHFRKHYLQLKTEVERIKRKGIAMTIAGVLMIMVATYLSYNGSNNLFSHFFQVLFEAGGWFTGWTGLDQIFYTAENKRNDLEFYFKMSKCKIFFFSIIKGKFFK